MFFYKFSFVCLKSHFTHHSVRVFGGEPRVAPLVDDSPVLVPNNVGQRIPGHLGIQGDRTPRHGPHLARQSSREDWLFDGPSHPNGAGCHFHIPPPVLVARGHPEEILPVSPHVVGIEGADWRHGELV